MSTTESETQAWTMQRQRLFDAGLLIPTGMDGLYGRSEAFEHVVAGIERHVGREGRELAARTVRFPPLMPRELLVRTDYLHSFPDLAGVIHAFEGDEAAHRELLRQSAAGEDWPDLLHASSAATCPATCHPLYPTLDRDVPDSGLVFDVYGYVFRHEPSLDPARLVSFRQYELVYVGTPEGARAHRDRCADAALDFLQRLGVDARSSVANDPFFGRAGRMLAANQRNEELKFEILAATSPAREPTAVASANCHEDHFGTAFDLRLADGSPAHTACVGYGVERITMALIWAHGTDPSSWPEDVRRILWS